MNSSPPKRESTSPSRNAACSRTAGLAQQRVARVMAVPVVDELEAIDVDEQHRARGRATLRQLELQLTGELPPVDEPGERIVLRRVRELQLGLLALGDVGEDALEAGLAVVVDGPAGLIANPHDAAVGMQEAILVVEQARLLGFALVAHHPRAIIRMDALRARVRGHAIHCSGGKPSIDSI